MNKKEIKLLAGGSMLIMLFGIIYLYLQNKKKDEQISVLKDINDDAIDNLEMIMHKLNISEINNLKLLIDNIKRTPSISEEIERQLYLLLRNFEKVDIKMANELEKAIELLKLGYTEKAIKDLVKILEQLLQTHYEKDDKFKSWLKEEKKPHNLHNLIHYCKEDGKIDEVEFQFIMAIKQVRNKEAHTVDFNLDINFAISGLLTGIRAISKIASLVYPEMIADNPSKLLSNNG